jgi:hypothetical protein
LVNQKNLSKSIKHILLLATVGENYKRIERQLPSQIASNHIAKNSAGNIYLCNFQAEVVFGFNQSGKKFLEWEASEIGQGHFIYYRDYQAPDFLWLRRGIRTLKQY